MKSAIIPASNKPLFLIKFVHLDCMGKAPTAIDRVGDGTCDGVMGLVLQANSTKLIKVQLLSAAKAWVDRHHLKSNGDMSPGGSMIDGPPLRPLNISATVIWKDIEVPGVELTEVSNDVAMDQLALIERRGMVDHIKVLIEIDRVHYSNDFDYQYDYYGD